MIVRVIRSVFFRGEFLGIIAIFYLPEGSLLFSYSFDVPGFKPLFVISCNMKCTLKNICYLVN